MLVRIAKSPSAAELDAIRELCDSLGLEARALEDSGQLLELTGPTGPETRSALEDCSAIRQVIDASEAPERFAGGEAPRVVRVGEAVFGGGRVSLIAGPCAVEDGEAHLEIARGVRAAGATALRGGIFKPRTSPYSFQGVGARGLDQLRRAREETGLAVVTEVLDPRDVELVAGTADMLQVGSRSMSNFPLLREVGRAGRPVLLKRGMAATVREFLLAAEYVLAEGNEEVVLCERGVRGFDSVTRNLLDLGAIAHLKQATSLPVVADPSHAAGRADLVPALSRAALAVGADGLIVEVNPRPEEAHSDGSQAISLGAFRGLVEEARAVTRALGRELVTGPPTFPSPAPTPELELA